MFDNTTFELYPTPISTGRLSTTGVLIGREQLRHHLMKEPRINPFASSILKEPYRLLTKDKLRSMASMTVPVDTPSSKKYLSRYESGRRFALLHGNIVFADNIGYIVSEKGGWRGGIIEQDPKFFKEIGSALGLFKSTDSERNLENSNLLIENGFRAALVLGDVPLDLTLTKNFLLDRYNGNVHMQNNIEEAFNLLLRRNEDPVLQFQAGGVDRRIGYGGVNVIEKDDNSSGALAQASRIIALEMERFPEKYKKYLLNGDSIENYIRIFNKAGRREVLTEQEYISFIDVYMAMGKVNAEALKKLVIQCNRESLKLPDNFISYLSQAKDVDYAGFSYDFEGLVISKEEGATNIDADKIASSYLLKWWNLMEEFHKKVSYPLLTKNLPKIVSARYSNEFYTWFNKRWDIEKYRLSND